MNTVNADSESYWASVQHEVAAFANSPVEVEEIPERTNEASTAYGLRFEGIGGYPLFAYLSVPVDGEGFVPLLQVPNYASVAGVPYFERRTRYAVMGLSHRGQRLSDSPYSAAYPGLLTEGLPGSNTYRFRDIVADSLRAIDVLVSRPEVDSSRLVLAGNDVAALVASLRSDVKNLLVVTPLLFSGVAARLTGSEDYPLREYNDFRRTMPEQWSEAQSTLAMFDPINRASKIGSAALIACTSAEKASAEALAAGIGDGAKVYVNTGYGFIDHKAQEEWLADHCGVERTESPFLPR